MTSPPLNIPCDVARILESGGLLAINHSGGKDSQAMTLRLLDAGIPRAQIIIVHAHLGDVEWPGTIAHIRRTTFGLPLIVTSAQKTFFEMVRARGMFPSPQYRQCTSDLKRGPIEKALRHHLRDNPQFGGRIVSAMGMRAAESSARARRSVVSVSRRNSRAGRLWVDWMPIHEMSTKAVFTTIANSRTAPTLGLCQGHDPPVLLILHYVVPRRSCLCCTSQARSSGPVSPARSRAGPHAEPVRHPAIHPHPLIIAPVIASMGASSAPTLTRTKPAVVAPKPTPGIRQIRAQGPRPVSRCLNRCQPCFDAFIYISPRTGSRQRLSFDVRLRARQSCPSRFKEKNGFPASARTFRFVSLSPPPADT